LGHQALTVAQIPVASLTEPRKLCCLVNMPREGVKYNMRFQFFKPDRSLVTLAGALCITLLALALSTAAAVDRAATLGDKTLMVVLYVTFCLLSHTILCLIKHRLSLRILGPVLALWLFSMIMTCSNHLSFLVRADSRAGDERSRQSIPVEANKNEIELVKVAVSKITARSISVIAAEISSTSDRKKRHALSLELDEAKRRVRLEDTLLSLTHNMQEIHSIESEDPFIHSIAVLLSISDKIVSMSFNLCISLFLELAGVVLWLEYSQGKKDEKETDGKIICSVDQITTQNKRTVEQIRVFFRCGQQKALELHQLTEGPRRKNGNHVLG
jgi:hypothetical protein